MLQQVCLLNADYTIIGIINWKKAIKLICKGKVEVLKTSVRNITNYDKTITLYIPEIIRLIKFVRSIWKRKVPFNKKNIAIRDNFTCQYCGKSIKTDGTIDHVVPRSKGGLSSFDNCVLACLPCNNKKDDRLSSVAKMYPRNQPYTPTISQFIQLHVKNVGLSESLSQFGII